MFDLVLSAFPTLMALEPEARRLLANGLRPVSAPAGTVLFSDGTACHAFVLLLEGSVRVQKVAETGREIVLYRVEPGQTCVLTTNCLLADGIYGADGVAETPLQGYTVSPSLFQELLARSAVFRRFVFSAYATRVSDLLMLIEEVAFGRIDQRLAQHLLARTADLPAESPIITTHQELAVELGSAREVISRQLKDFERRGWLILARGRISVTNPNALATVGLAAPALG
jgi:CRP/FNR family transcriptional regulator